MSGCPCKEPKFRVDVHSPANPFHKHVNKPIQIKAESDWQAWAELIRQSLATLGYTNDKLVVGFLLDLINGFPEEHRQAIVTGVKEGRGLDVSVEEGEVIIDLPQKYEPLEGDKKTKSGLVVPKGTPIAIPGVSHG